MKGKPSDNAYGCPGKERLPRIAVGRFPARTVGEAKGMVAKTLAYENDRWPDAWRHRVTVLAGAPGFGAFVDGIVEKLAFDRLGKLDPYWNGRAIYHNPSSRFSLPDEQLNKRARQYLQGGQALILYLGHSNARGFASGRLPYLDRDDWANLKIPRGPGVFATFGCFGCQVGPDDEGYGVAAIRNPGGPVAVLGSQGECFSTMVFPAVEGLIGSFCAPRPPRRLGEAWLRLKEAVARGKISNTFFALLNLADGDTKISQAVQRQEHLEMFVLLGDPALRLPVTPRDVKLTCAGTVAAGKTITVRGKVPARLAKAKVVLALERPLDAKPLGLEKLPNGPPAMRAKVMLANHELANHFTLFRKEILLKGNTFEARLELPAKLPWRRLTVRAYVAFDRAEGLGILVVPVNMP
jgi:hypothetical protein